MMQVDQAKITANAKFLWRRTLTAFALCGLLVSCLSVPPPGKGRLVPWEDLPGWQDEPLAQSWPALLNSCQKLPARDARWKDTCFDATLFTNPDDVTARAFFETRFQVRQMVGLRGKREGLVTGYYEPLLSGSLKKTERYRYPLYGRPSDLVTVDLGDLYPELRGKSVRGRLLGSRVVPYYTRAEINRGQKPLNADVLVWVDDAVALFFLEVQGSGRVRLPDGQMLYVGYADQNGHPYYAIGRKLVEMGAMPLEDVTLPNIRAWLLTHPEQTDALLNSNPSRIFFALRDTALPGPLGALNVPLLPERAIAVDPAFIPLGSPVWLDTSLAGPDAKPYRRLVFAQDTGGAITGATRADLFLGFGADAERLAGEMKQPGYLYVLEPVPRVKMP